MQAEEVCAGSDGVVSGAKCERTSPRLLPTIFHQNIQRGIIIPDQAWHAGATQRNIFSSRVHRAILLVILGPRLHIPR